MTFFGEIKEALILDVFPIIPLINYQSKAISLVTSGGVVVGAHLVFACIRCCKFDSSQGQMHVFLIYQLK